MAEPPCVPTTSKADAVKADAVDPYLAWCGALEERHLRDLSFPEVRRGLEALSAVYVERRDRLGRGGALDGAGKRAAFALFYAPLHFQVVRMIARGLEFGAAAARRIIDLGCGTGAAGAALALEIESKRTEQPERLHPRPSILGIDINRWAVEEARWNWRQLGLQGEGRVGDAVAAAAGDAETALVAAYCVNELPAPAQKRLQQRLLAAAAAGARVLVVEPIALRPLPWWQEWKDGFEAAGGHAGEWQIAPELPPRIRLLDKAAGLRHASVKARSLYLAR